MAVGTTLALIIAGAGIGLQAYGQVRAGQAAKEAGKAQRASAESEAQLAEYNAAVARIQSTDAEKRGAEAANRFRTQIKEVIASQRAGYAAGNIDVQYGSAVDVQDDARLLGELDMLTLRTNAAREAWGFDVQEQDLRRRAEIARKEGVYHEAAGRAAATSHYVGAAATVASGGGSLLLNRYGFRS